MRWNFFVQTKISKSSEQGNLIVQNRFPRTALGPIVPKCSKKRLVSTAPLKTTKIFVPQMRPIKFSPLSLTKTRGRACFPRSGSISFIFFSISWRLIEFLQICWFAKSSIFALFCTTFFRQLWFWRSLSWHLGLHLPPCFFFWSKNCKIEGF